MLNITNELKAKLLAAKSAEEVADLLKADGQEVEPDDAEKLWMEVTKKRQKNDRKLYVDELDAVSGGADRDWLEVGCAATVEPGSWCGSNDWCAIADVTYENSPNKVCLYCGRYSIFIGRVEFRKPGVAHEKKYWCSSCKRIEYVVENPTI